MPQVACTTQIESRGPHFRRARPDFHVSSVSWSPISVLTVGNTCVRYCTHNLDITMFRICENSKLFLDGFDNGVVLSSITPITNLVDNLVFPTSGIKALLIPLPGPRP